MVEWYCIIRCDNKNCGKDSNNITSTIHELELDAISKGWAVVGKKHYCPQHEMEGL